MIIKRKKTKTNMFRNLLLLGIFILINTTIWATIASTPVSPNVEQKVTFTVTPPSGYILGPISWNFGDGNVGSYPQPSATHNYKAPGTYLVTATYTYQSGVQTLNQIDKLQVVIKEKRNITYTPSNPKPNQAVTFKANSFLSPSIKWNFGDGTIKFNGSSVEIHKYQKPGTYIVRAMDFNGTSCCPVTTTVSVGVAPDIKKITYNPMPATTKREITFMATNFTSTCVKWVFGDGTVAADGKPLQTHVYKKTGTYTVTAFDNCGSDPSPVSVVLTVMPHKGPGAPFSISFIQLRFADGKSYCQVSRDDNSLEAFADIKYEGTGIFQVQWLVDDKPFRIESRTFPFARQDTITSGKNPPLPTQVPGIHELSLNIIQPKVEFKIPRIRYFVTPGELEKKVELLISKVEDLEGNPITLEKNRVSLVKNKHYLFSGNIKNLSKSKIASAVLQVYVAEKLMDQIMIRNLNPQKQIAFKTSFVNDSALRKILNFRVVDTSVGGKILGDRTMDIISPSPPMSKAQLTVFEGSLEVNGNLGPQVNVLPGQPFSVNWDTSASETAQQVKIHLDNEIWTGVNLQGASSGTMSIAPSDPMEFGERRALFGFVQDAAGTNLGVTNTITVNAYDLTTATKTLSVLEIVDVRASGPLEDDSVSFSIDLRNNSNQDRIVTIIRISPCIEDVAKGPQNFDCSSSLAYSNNPNLQLSPGQIITTDIVVPRDDIDLNFIPPIVSFNNFIPVSFRVIAQDNLGFHDQYNSAPIDLSRTGFDLGISKCELIERVRFNWQKLGGYMAMLNHFAKKVRFHVKNCGDSGTYTGPLSFHCHNGAINLMCPEEDFTIADGETVVVDCELRYQFPPRSRSYAQEPLFASLELPDDYAANNMGQSQWVINTFPNPFKDVKVKDVSVMNNNSPNPTIKFKVKNKSDRKPSPGQIHTSTPAVAVDGVSVRAFHVGGNNNPIWGPALVGGDGHMEKNEAIEMFIPGSALLVGENTIRIEAYFSSGGPDNRTDNNQKTKNYHKTFGTAGPADLKIKDVSRQNNNSNNVIIRFKVKNKGDSDSSGYTINYLIDGEKEPFFSEQGAALPAGAQREHWIGNGLNPGQHGLTPENHTLKISVVSNNLNEEVNMSNNVATKNYNRENN